MSKSAETVRVPFLLSFGEMIPGTRFRELIPGRGEAGWGVAEFPSKKDARDFMLRNGASAMPCWRNLDTPDGLGSVLAGGVAS